MEFKAHDYPEIYEDLGIDLRTLGCVMLKAEQPDTSFIDDEDLYVSSDPAKFWIKGRAAGNSHVTLRYGLLSSVRQEHARRILDDVYLPRNLFVSSVEMFESPYSDDPYECIVARVDSAGKSGMLQEANIALSLLPNVSTFSEYKPHITLAYVKKGWWWQNSSSTAEFIDSVGMLRTKGLDFGKMIP